MLEMLRSAVGGWVAKIFIGLLIASFAVWGVADNMTNNAGSAAITVGETAVAPIDYRLAYDRAVNRVSQQLGQVPSRQQARLLGIDAQVQAEVVSGALLDEHARIENLGLSEETLARLIGEDPSFRDSAGRFNRIALQQVLQTIGMNEDMYVRNRSAVAVRNQLVEAGVNGLELPDAYMGAFKKYVGEKRKMQYLVIDASTLDTTPEPSDEQLTSYYEENKSRYDAPEYRKLNLLELTPDTIANEAAVTDAEIKADYEKNSALYQLNEKRRIQQIVFPNKEEADEAFKQLSEGLLFETLLSNRDLEAKDVDLGLLDKASLPDQKIADAAFALEQNQSSEVVEGAFGPVIIRAVEIVPASTTPLAEVEGEIRKQVALSRAADEINDLYDSIEDARAGGSTLKEAAERFNMKIRTVEAIDRTAQDMDANVINDIPSSAAVLSAAFDADVGVETDPITVGSSGTVWFEVAEVIAKRERDLSEVKDKVKEAWVLQETVLAATKKADELKDKIAAGASFDTVAAEVSKKPFFTNDIKRNDSVDLLPRPVIEKAFVSKKGDLFIANGKEDGTQLVVRVEDVIDAAPDDNTLDEAYQNRLNGQAADTLLAQFIDKLQGKYPVAVDQSVIEFSLNNQSGY